MKARVWYYHCPGMFPAISFEFRDPVDEREARAYIRMVWYDDAGRLPNGSTLWSK